MKDHQNVQQLYDSLKKSRDEHMPLWKDISRFVGISVDPQYSYVKNQGRDGDVLDEFIDDPTGTISVNQFGDYLLGIMWGTGDNALEVVPSRHVLELADISEVEEYYSYTTSQTLHHMNHSESGLHTSLRPYAYDQASFGTSGIGTFPNPSFMDGVDECALLFRNFGVDNICIDAGKSGLIDYVFATFHWRVNRIIGEFCMKGGVVSEELVKKLPDAIQKAYKSGNFTEQFTIVFGMLPNTDFNPKYRGKRGTKFRGVWFLDGQGDKPPFREEWFKDRPINVCRQILVRGDVYGRASGTMLLSTIRSVNFMVATTIEIMEKMANPSLGIFNNAIFGDTVLDTSPNGMTIFNSALAGDKGSPAFPLFDVGDPSAIVNFLVPYLNEKITTAFKIDALLDFSSAKEMTATESMQRYAIRGKSLSGLLQQQKVEMLDPTAKRVVNVLMELGELGVDPRKLEQSVVERLQRLGRTDRMIPQAVLECIAEGKPWFEIKFNNELEKLTRTQSIESLIQLVNSITAIAALYPMIVEAVDWHKLLSDINQNLDANNQIILSEVEFKKKVQAAAQKQQALLQLQAGQQAASTQKDVAQADKMNREAQ